MKTEVNNSTRLTKPNVPGADMKSLLVAPRSLLFHPLSLGEAHPVVPVRRSRTDDADSSPSAHPHSLHRLLPWGQRPPHKLTAGVVLQRPRQTILPKHCQRRSRGDHLPPGSRRENSLSLVLIFYSYIASAKRALKFRHMPGFSGVLQQRR